MYLKILSEACFQDLPESAICVQRFDDSRSSAIRITYRISLRSSSLREPRYPLLRVVRGLNFVLSQLSSLVRKKRALFCFPQLQGTGSQPLQLQEWFSIFFSCFVFYDKTKKVCFFFFFRFALVVSRTKTCGCLCACSKHDQRLGGGKKKKKQFLKDNIYINFKGIVSLREKLNS